MRLSGSERGVDLRILYSEQEIAAVVKRIASEISRDYSEKDLLLVVVLKGAFIFAADLVRMLTIPVKIDFVKLKSYVGSESSGTVRITRDIETEAAGKDLLIVEDIIDTGLTLDFLLRHLSGKDPRSIKVCSLVDKRIRRKIDIKADYSGVVCDGGFLIGYGLDLDERCREFGSIYEVVEQPSGGMHDNTM
jgi:hypoxanthine phosphoribosyltransferase